MVQISFIEGPKNLVADALSRLGLKDHPDFKNIPEQCNFYESQIMAVNVQKITRSMQSLYE